MKAFRSIAILFSSAAFAALAVVAPTAPASAARPVAAGILEITGSGMTDTSSAENGHFGYVHFVIDPVRGPTAPDAAPYLANVKIITTVRWMDGNGKVLVTGTGTALVPPRGSDSDLVTTAALPDSVVKVQVSADMYSWTRHGGWTLVDTARMPATSIPAPSSWWQFAGECSPCYATSLFTYTDTD